MTKEQIVKEIARQTGVEAIAVLATVEAFMATVKKSVAGGETVYLRGFGSFGTKVRKEKVARNIRAKVSLTVPEHKIPFFKPSRKFKEDVL